MQTLTLFVSSPADVLDERQAVGRIVERLQARYWNFIRLEPVLWEKEPLRATAHFNEELIRPSDCELFVCILWSRLGSPLPSQFNRKDGSRFESGTEWELEEATEAYEKRAETAGEKAHPDILVYRRTSEPPPAGPDQADARVRQRELLDSFCQRFFFNEDGTIRRAFSPYGSVDEFTALFEQHLEKLLLRQIRLQRGLAESAVRPLPLEGSPFKGLGTFGFEDAPLFFGRNRPIAEALGQLKRNHEAGHAFLLIYGGSGYGKSSLMRAGIAPRLTAEGYLPDAGTWRRTTILPVQGDVPVVETLARGLIAALPELEKLPDSWDVARLARGLSDPGTLPIAVATLIAGLDLVSAAHPSPLLVMIDQLEEIFTAASVTPSDREAFFHVLAALAMSHRIWVIATMRSEFFPRVPEHRDLFQLVRHGGGYILSPPELPELHQIIRYPALAAGLQFERHPESGRDLSEQIYQDAAEAGDALPLLEFTLEELYQRRRGNLLTWEAYDELGGLAGAIARTAQETYEGLPSETRREAARQIFGELVTLNAGREGTATRRRALRDTLHDAHPGAPAFIDAFVDAKLLVTGSGDDSAATVTLAHEALITHWPVLSQWIADHKDLLLARRRLEDATRLWIDGHRPQKYFLTEGRLAEAERVAECGVFRLTVDESELIRLSRQRARRKLRFFQAATGVFAALAIAAGVLGVVARKRQVQALAAEDRALSSARETRRTLAAADLDAGAARAAEGAPDEALPHLLAALENDPANRDAQALLIETLRRTTWHFPEITLRHPLPVRQVAFGPDRETLFSSIDSSSSGEGFNTTLRWDLSRLSIEGMLAPQWGQLTQTLSVSPGARHVVVQRDYKWIGPTFLCDGTDLRLIARLPVSMLNTYPSTCFAWSPDGLLLAFPAAAEGGMTWRIIDAATGGTVRESEVFRPANADWCSASLDRKRLRAVTGNGLIFELPLQPQQPVRRSQLTSGEAFRVFSPDGNELIQLNPGDHRNPPVQSVLRIRDEDLGVESTLDEDSAAWASARAFAERFPWTWWESPFWERMANPADSMPSAFRVDGPRLSPTLGDFTRREPVAPVHADATIECAALSGDRLATGTAAGTLTIHRLLPVLGHGLPGDGTRAPGEGSSNRDEGGWTTISSHGDTSLQLRGRNWRLLPANGTPIQLQPHPGWDSAADVAVSSDGKLVVLGGFSSGSGGYSSSGIILSDPTNGARLGDLEPVAALRNLSFLGDSHRLAVVGSAGVLITDVRPDGFDRVSLIPVTDALSVHYIESRHLLAVASDANVSLFDTRDFSKVATLDFLNEATGADWEQGSHRWAWDDECGWLACQRSGLLHVWSLAAQRPLVSGLNLPLPADMRFGRKDGFAGLALREGVGPFLSLARVDPLSDDEIGVLRALSESLSGTRFAPGTRSITVLTPNERIARSREVDPALLGKLLPGNGAPLGVLTSLSPRSPEASTWLPVWQRLATGSSEAAPSIARWASSLGADHPWLQSYLRGLIGASDRRLFRYFRDKSGAPTEPDALQDEDIAHFHRIAGDPDSTGSLKQAAWLALRTDPAVAGRILTDASTREEFPNLDHDAVARLDPIALNSLRSELADADMRDPRIVLLDEMARRPAAMELLESRTAATLADYMASPGPSTAIGHATALALGGDPAAAGRFLSDKLPEGFKPTLGEAHFLVSIGIDPPVEVLDKDPSLQLLLAWLDNAKPADLASKIEVAMKQVGGSGPAAIFSLQIAIRAINPTAITTVLNLAKDIPVAVREFATARALWLGGRKTDVFALWPEELPDYYEITENSDLRGWEEVLHSEEAETFFREIEEELESLDTPDIADVESLREHANRLLDPATVSTFGPKRVRQSMVSTALALASDAASSTLVDRLVEQARLAGAPPENCLRAEARSLMARGDFTAAYASWLRLIESVPEHLTAADHFEAARCLFEDLQDQAAIQLLIRGRDHFPKDSEYLHEVAWLLLSTGHPEEAGVFLEHGFELSFSPERSETAMAMLVCAAELTERADRADATYQELISRSPGWGDVEALKSLDWPEEIKNALLSVADRNR